MKRLELVRSADGHRVSVIFQPGNGTRYEAYGVQVDDLNPSADAAWVVAFPLFGTAYIFRQGACAEPGYIAEKLGNFRSGSKGSYQSTDIHEMCKIIAMIVPYATHAAKTDETGHFPDQLLVQMQP